MYGMSHRRRDISIRLILQPEEQYRNAAPARVVIASRIVLG